MSRFILSCTTCATRLPNKDELEQCLRHAPAAGYKSWGVAGPLFTEAGLLRWADLDRLARRAAEVGLTCCTEVYGRSFPTDSDAAAREAAPDRVPLFDAAEKLGAPIVVITGRKRTEGGIGPTIAGLKALLPLIAGRPVRLALEPHYGSQIQYAEDYDAIFEQIDSPQVGLTLDSGHFHSAGVDWRRLIERYASRIYNFHVKDHIGTQSVALGAGEVDLAGYLAALHAIDYDGALAVELEVADPENLLRYMAEAFTYLSDLVPRVTGQPAVLEA